MLPIYMWNLWRVIRTAFHKVELAYKLLLKPATDYVLITDIEIPEKPRLKLVERVPQYPGSIKAPRMFKRLDLMRGPELVHNSFLYKQYGIVVSMLWLSE